MNGKDVLLLMLFLIFIGVAHLILESFSEFMNKEHSPGALSCDAIGRHDWTKEEGSGKLVCTRCKKGLDEL